MQDQGIEDQRIVNDGLLPIARDLELPLVCTNDVHYLNRTDQHPHDILLCIGTGKSVSDEKRLRYHGDQFFLKTADEMAAVFGAYPGGAAATRCSSPSGATCVLPTGEAHLPDFPVPPGYTVDGYFEEMVRAGFDDRLVRLQALAERGELRHPLADYEARLAYEIDMIRRMNYAGYFLIVWDFIRYARERGIPVGPGRGSAAGSIVAYCLRITDVDPLHFDLYFERFLNPERVSLPDIDIDFCERRRGEVINYVTAKYGRENVAQIITFGTMKARAVVRDVGRVMEMPVSEVDRVAKLIPNQLDMTLEMALQDSPPLAEAEKSDERVKQSARRRAAPRGHDAPRVGARGRRRHHAQAADGVRAALQDRQKDEITTQWAMKEIERVGLLKMDFLGLSTLTLLDDAVKHIKETTGQTIDLDRLPEDDAKTYQLFQNGQTHGVFQFESSGMRDTLRKAKPQCLEDLDRAERAVPARPAARRGRRRLHQPQARARRGRCTSCRRWSRRSRKRTASSRTRNRSCASRATWPASRWARPTNCGARWARRTPRKMQAQREAFMAGCRERGIPEKKAGKIFELIDYFAGYGFNKSHSTAYALLAYQTAYLKANFPRHFMAALLTIESEDTDKIALYLDECRELGVPILPPDINRSELPFVVQPDGVRFGLGAVKGAGQGAIHIGPRDAPTARRHHHVAVRAGRARRSPPGEQEGARGAHQGRRLGRACRPKGREDYLALAREAGGRTRPHPRPRQPSPEGPQPGAGTAVRRRRRGRTRPTTMPACRPVAAVDGDRGARRREGSARPVHERPSARSAMPSALAAAGARPLAALTQSEADVSIGGGVGGLRLLKTRRGDRMAVFMLEAEDGKVEAVVYPEAFARYGQMISAGAMVLVRGKYERDEETSKLVVAEITPLEVVRERAVREVEITLSGKSLGTRPDAPRRRRARAASGRPPRVVHRARERRGPARSRCARRRRGESGRRSTSSGTSRPSAAPDRSSLK